MITIYSKPDCSYCVKAKDLMLLRGIPFTELIMDVGQPKTEGVAYYTVPQLKEVAPSARTVPQIFENGVLIGGFDSLKKHLG